MTKKSKKTSTIKYEILQLMRNKPGVSKTSNQYLASFLIQAAVLKMSAIISRESE